MTDDVGSSMRGSVHALMSNLIDYAGLFPPAALDMPQVVTNYAAVLAGPDAWMIERMIVPVRRLDELETAAAGHWPDPAVHEPWPISGLVVPADDPQLPADLERIEIFNRAHAGQAVIDVIELKARTSRAIDIALDEIPETLFPFFEIPVDEDPRGLIASLAGGDAGAKIRTGGVTADLYPPTHAVARFIAACATAGVAFKATAGLHHPVRHHSDAVGTDEFGFLGVFVAAAMAWQHELAAEDLVTILETRDPAAFVFDDTGVHVDGRFVSCDEIEDARLTYAISFGSCSFDEPLEDLRRLGLLPAAGKEPS